MPRLSLLLLGLIATVALGPSCAGNCRVVDVRPLDLTCGEVALEGEIHFDSAAAFETFLTDQCIPEADDVEVASIVDGVDFSRDAVWVGVRRNAIDESRCIENRQLEATEVCDNGLRVSFVDVLRDDAGDVCTGRWTVAFVIPRDELLAALDAADGQ